MIRGLSKHLRTASCFRSRALGGLVCSIVLLPYVFFQAHLLPKSLNYLVSKMYFWPTFPLTILKQLLIGDNHWVTIDDKVILGSAPMPWHVATLKELKVTGVVNMQSEYCGPVEMYKMAHINQLRLPVDDHIEPSVEVMRKGIEFIEQTSGCAYVHCKAGHGRGAAMALAWLTYKNPERSLEELNEVLSAKRHVRRKMYLQSNLLELKDWVDSTCAKSRQ
eukprot:GEMP01049071.1.p1 GENE.GEMP01049071.1~~GEMP01049071.1.p1  ORF type:complete len:220 (+),score=36.14 GEMP01049071.1:121-780(+)